MAVSKSGRSLESEDVQNFLHARERGIDVHLFVRKNKDDKISKEFYYLGRMAATGRTREFQMPQHHQDGSRDRVESGHSGSGGYLPVHHQLNTEERNQT